MPAGAVASNYSWKRACDRGLRPGASPSTRTCAACRMSRSCNRYGQARRAKSAQVREAILSRSGRVSRPEAGQASEGTVGVAVRLDDARMRPSPRVARGASDACPGPSAERASPLTSSRVAPPMSQAAWRRGPRLHLRTVWSPGLAGDVFTPGWLAERAGLTPRAPPQGCVARGRGANACATARRRSR